MGTADTNMAIRASQIQRSVTKQPKVNEIGAAGSGDYPPEVAAIRSVLKRSVRSYLQNRSIDLLT